MNNAVVVWRVPIGIGPTPVWNTGSWGKTRLWCKSSSLLVDAYFFSFKSMSQLGTEAPFCKNGSRWVRIPYRLLKRF